MCKETFPTNTMLKDHMKECNGVSYRCEICDTKFMSARRLMLHKRVCSYRDMESDSEMENIEDETPKGLDLLIDDNQNIPDGMIPNNHLNPRGQIIPTRPYFAYTKRPRCPVCKKKFPVIEYLKRHIDDSVELYQPLRHCIVCKVKFDEDEDLKSHLKDCEDVTYTCQVCDEDFQTIKRLERHMAAWHNDLNAGYYNKRKRGYYESEGEDSDGDNEQLVKRQRNDEDSEDDSEIEIEYSDDKDE